MALSVIAPRILCIGIPVRDLTFRVEAVPERGSKANATHLAEICGGNALNAAIPGKRQRRPTHNHRVEFDEDSELPARVTTSPCGYGSRI